MQLLIMTYHYFHQEKPYGIKREDHVYSVSNDTLAAHCESVKASVCQVVDYHWLFEDQVNQGNQAQQVLFTIDDGHISVAEIAAPILRQYGIRPIIHVIPDMVGTQHYLSWSALRELDSDGFSIQSHSLNHRDLTKLNATELRSDLSSSRQIIEDKIGEPVQVLAVPMGRLNKLVARTAWEVGYNCIFTSYTGINKNSDDLKLARRFQVKQFMLCLPLDDYFHTWSRIRLVGGLKNIARRFINSM